MCSRSPSRYADLWPMSRLWNYRAMALGILLIVPGLETLLAHKGVRHGKGPEQHPRVEVLEVG